LPTDSTLQSDRKAVLEAYVTHETRIQTEDPSLAYTQVLSRVHAALAEDWGVAPDSELDQAFGESVGRWDPFPDTIEALRALSKHYKLVILSNVDHSSFNKTRQKLEAGGDWRFDKVVTAQDVGPYKPSRENFRYALTEVRRDFGIEDQEVLVTANSLLHDHRPANLLGLSSAWIERRGAVMGVGSSEADVKYTFKFETMGAMADAVEEGVVN
jgi:2-haloalkanoic acid dehalogenase type II